jgi:hypothetical protein
LNRLKACHSVDGWILRYFLFGIFKTRIANLLGVVGADIPVSDIKKLMQPFLVSNQVDKSHDRLLK